MMFDFYIPHAAPVTTAEILKWAFSMCCVRLYACNLCVTGDKNSSFESLTSVICQSIAGSFPVSLRQTRAKSWCVIHMDEGLWCHVMWLKKRLTARVPRTLRSLGPELSPVSHGPLYSAGFPLWRTHRPSPVYCCSFYSWRHAPCVVPSAWPCPGLHCTAGSPPC